MRYVIFCVPVDIVCFFVNIFYGVFKIKKNTVIILAFIMCILFSEGALASWYYASVSKTGIANVSSDSIVSNSTGIDFYVSSTSGTIHMLILHKTSAGDSYRSVDIIPGSENFIDEDEFCEATLSYFEDNYYRLDLKGWGQGYGWIQIHNYH